MPAYFDTNATTPVDPRVADIVIRYLTEEFGNAGSRTHSFGSRAAKAVELARDQIANAVKLESGRVVFTSGATESNNLAILGLEELGNRTGKRHLVTTAIEHKAVLEPLEHLTHRGFTLEVVFPEQDGVVPAEKLLEQVREDTLLVSLMHVNNETGMIQPVAPVAEALRDTETLVHVDAAQGFGKDFAPLTNPCIDFISISSHKIYGPKGSGALLINEKNKKNRRLSPIMFGGGQETGLRPGTLPVPLIAGFGLAAELARKEHAQRIKENRAHLQRITEAAKQAGGEINGNTEDNVGNVLNVSFPGVDSESAILLLQDHIAISNGAACTSTSYTYSHVLEAMGLSRERIESAIRISWYHNSESIEWPNVFSSISALM